MLEWKDYVALDLVFKFVAGFIDRATGHIDEAPMTKVHTMYSDLARRLGEYRGNGESSSQRLTGLGEEIQHFKELVKAMFEEHCGSGLYMLKLHLLDHVVEVLERYGSLEMLHGSPFERFNVHIKHGYRRTSQRRMCGIMKTFVVMDETREENLTMYEGRDEAENSPTAEKWKRIE